MSQEVGHDQAWWVRAVVPTVPTRRRCVAPAPRGGGVTSGITCSSVVRAVLGGPVAGRVGGRGRPEVGSAGIGGGG